MQLLFKTTERGDVALADLKANLALEGVEITHPKFMKDKSNSFGTSECVCVTSL